MIDIIDEETVKRLSLAISNHDVLILRDKFGRFYHFDPNATVRTSRRHQCLGHIIEGGRDRRRVPAVLNIDDPTTNDILVSLVI